MALKVVGMAELRLKVILEPERTGDSVAEVCRRHGISRDTFYEYKRRYLAEGIDGLEPRSRQPHHSPARIDIDLEVKICKMRKDHKRWGARTIRTELLRSGVDAPAESTIHQVLRRNHLVADQPKKRPKFMKRFERETPNDLWQIDATQLKLDNRGKAWAMNTLDDHARFLLSSIACEGPTGEAAIACFDKASARYGLPRQVLSDNGFCFTGKLQGFEVEFERKLEHLGVQLINSGPYHPQTLGKLERFHKTLKEWLQDEEPAKDLVHLQKLLDRFRTHYNQDRPHQGIGDITPAERYQPSSSASESLNGSKQQQRGEGSQAGEPIYPPRSLIRKVNARGVIGLDGYFIGVGRRWIGASVRVEPIGQLVQVFYGEELIRVLAIDPERLYQGQGKPRERNPRHR